MLRKELKLKDPNKIKEIIEQCTTCRIAMIADEKPYILPMVFGYEWNENLYLYFHCGLRGRKNAALKENCLVCFEMDIEGELTGIGGPSYRHSRNFSAIIGEGNIEFAKSNIEKKEWFEHIMKHQTGKTGWEYPDAYLATTEVFRIKVSAFQASHK